MQPRPRGIVASTCTGVNSADPESIHMHGEWQKAFNLGVQYTNWERWVVQSSPFDHATFLVTLTMQINAVYSDDVTRCKKSGLNFGQTPNYAT